MPKYTKHIVIFMDILGFKEVIKKTNSESAPSENITVFFHHLADAKGIFKIQPNILLKHTYVSDAIVITCPSPENDSDRETRLLVALHTASYFWVFALQNNLLLRGSISEGDLIHSYDKNINEYQTEYLYGPAFIDAYELEKNARFPRVILSDEIADEIKNPKNNKSIKLNQLITRDFDGVHFLDVKKIYDYMNNLTSYQSAYPDPEKIIKIFYEGNFKGELKTNVNLKAKYYWLWNTYLKKTYPDLEPN